MLKFAVLFALVATAVAEPIPRLNPLSPTGRIVGGAYTSISQVPYQVSLRIIGKPICGGSIISTEWVLTAAQCMIYPITSYTMRTGSSLSSTGGKLTGVSEVISHADYGRNQWNVPTNDIALIRLKSPLRFDLNQAAIGLFAAGQESAVGAPAVISGWGRLTDGGNATIILQSVTIPIISKADCNAAYNTSWGGLPDGQICAGVPEGGLDACKGDSGGPLAIDGVLAGIVSWGNGCARPGFPGVYTEVAYYRSWITENSGI